MWISKFITVWELRSYLDAGWEVVERCGLNEVEVRRLELIKGEGNE